MTNGPILWGLNSFLVAVCFFFVKIWISSLGRTIDKMEMRLALKLDSITCLERNSSMKTHCEIMAKHKHAPNTQTGGGGEVIIP